MYDQTSLWDTDTPTSSPESAAGRMLCDSQAGRRTSLCGQAHAPVNLTPRQALEKGMTTRGPYGGRGDGSSTSVDLQLSLASKLRQKLDVNGSPEYVLTWKQWDMPSGPPICQLRASVRRTSGNGYGGWPTPIVDDAKNVTRTSGSYKSLARTATMAGWRTPSASDGEGGSMDVLLAQRNGYSPKLKLRDQAPLAMTHGEIPSGSPVQTERRGALNPALSLWLMGYPDEWLS